MSNEIDTIIGKVNRIRWNKTEKFIKENKCCDITKNSKMTKLIYDNIDSLENPIKISSLLNKNNL